MKEKPKNKNLFLNSQKDLLIVFLSATTILFAKLFVSYNVYGTNDMTYWIGFANIIEKFGTFKIYSLIEIYNHPPLMSWILKIIKLIEAKIHLGFPFLFRLMPIVADYASIFVIWGLLKKYKVKNKVLICLICILNPINFLISGFHGNVDSVFVFLVLLAIYLLENNNIILSGLIYGLSICIKVAPVILAPIFFWYLKIKKDKITFISFFLILPLIIFLPYLIQDYNSVIKNIFLYSSIKGIWGLGHIFSSIFRNANIDIHIRNLSYALFRLHIDYFLIIFLTLIIFLSKSLIKNRKLNLLEGTFLAFSLFLAITPGFGVQYLSWLSLFAVIVSFALGVIYVLLGGVFLYRVYSYWGARVPPYYANSDKIGQWVGFENFLDIILWLIIVIMLVKFLFSVRQDTYVKWSNYHPRCKRA